MASDNEATNVFKVDTSNDIITESEYEDSYNYDEDEYYSSSSSTAPNECKNTGNRNVSVFEETQKSTYTELPRNVYCDIVDTLETQCFEQSLLEIWMYNEKTIRQLSKLDILDAVNNLDSSPYFGFQYNYSKLLGSVGRNKSGHIISAKAALYYLATVVDLSKIKPRSFLTSAAGVQRSMDEPNILWQDQAIKIILNNFSLDKGTFYHLFLVLIPVLFLAGIFN